MLPVDRCIHSGTVGPRTPLPVSRARLTIPECSPSARFYEITTLVGLRSKTSLAERRMMLWQEGHSVLLAVLLAEGATGLMGEGSITDWPLANCSPTILPCNMDGPRNVP